MKVLITGTSKGIGKATALKFLKEGHEVIGFDILESSIEDKNYTHYIQDISSDLPDIKDIEILVNNAGIQEGNVIKVNLEGTINVTEKYINEKIKSIVFIASSSATTGSEFPEYAASKGGILAYMRNVALRVSKYKATANSISPGGVITELNDHILNDPKLYKAVLDESLLGKWATPEEIAEVIYHIGVLPSYVTGQIITADGGWI